MVDAAAAVSSIPTQDAAKTRAVDAVPSFDIRRYDAAARADYASFAGTATHGAHQNPLFVEAWTDETAVEIVLVTATLGGRPVMMLPLEIVHGRLAACARFPGGTHANGNFPAIAPGFDSQPGLAQAMLHALKAARPDLSMLALARMEPVLGGRRNPLQEMASGPSPNIALAVKLDGGFEALMERVNGKRKRKKYRSQVRKFEEAGGHAVISARNATQCDAFLDAYFALKRERFRKMGIADPFDGTGAFFSRLYRDALGQPHPPFRLHGLEVGGRLRAVAATSVTGSRLVCDFCAIAEDELAQASPGDFLFFEMIRQACEDGYSVFDFSVGDEAYKRTWCDVETSQFDAILPLDRRGAIVAGASRARSAMIAAVKSNTRMFGLVKSVRRRLAGRPALSPGS